MLAILQPVFGEIALLDGKERTADARAMTGCDLAVLERRDVLEFVARLCLRPTRRVDIAAPVGGS